MSGNEKRKKDDDSGNSSKKLRSTDDPVLKKRRETADPTPSTSLVPNYGGPRAGVVKKLFMKNFMCHPSLEVNFHPKINFVVGRNGSGKSAILTALVVGLGGKASTTNRGSSLKEFIKKGMNSATIEVTINNTGIFCYKPDVYGESIIVTRTINSTTGSSYKVKSENGTVIYSGKEELERIVAALNIQVDNPVSVLNQDSSRTFLNSSDPREKFILFMKATQIEKLYIIYKESLMEKHRASDIINSRKESLGEAKKEVSDLERKWKTLKSLGDYRKRAQQLEDELYWSVAINEENKAKEIQQTLNEHLTKLPDSQGNVNKESESEAEAKRKLKEIEEELENKKMVITAREQQYLEFKEEVVRRKDNYAMKMKVYKSLVAKSQRMAVNVETLKQAIENFNSVSSSEQADKRYQIQQEIEQLEQRQTDVQHTLKTKKQYWQQVSANIEKVTSDQHSLLQEKQEHTRKIERRQQEIRSLKNESHNSLTVFGAWAPRISQKIDEACKRGIFQLRPRGPLGAYIKLKDASWAPAVESFLGRLLRTYCVNSSKDSQVLNQIFKEVLGSEKKPAIISGRFVDKVHNVQKYAVQSNEYSSIMDMLIVSDAVVFNTLIDQREIESILLIPTGGEAARIMSDASIVPRNCKRAITKKGDQFYPDPNYRTYAGDGNMKAKFLQVSMEEAISAAEEDLRNNILQREEVEKQLKVVDQHISESRSETNAVAKSIKELRSEDFNIQSRLTELKDIEEPEPNSVASLATELKESTDAYEKAREEEKVLEAECQQFKRDFEESEFKVRKIRDNCREIQNEERPLLNQKVNIQSELKEILSKKRYQQEKNKELCQRIASIEAELSKQQDAVKKAVGDALMICERIETDRSPHAVNKELIDCRSYMASVEQLTGSIEEVGSSYIEKKTKYNKIIDDLKTLENGVKKLEAMIDNRTKIIITLEKLAALRVHYMFQSLMHSHKYVGDLNIDHRKKTLEIQVCPGNVKEKGMSDTKSLSGGERSYATVAFFMALWDTVEPPFYFLDEFDVFMDKVNRHIIMDLLLEHARQKSNYQFVFLTPQDTSNIHSDPDIKIHRMEDPRRTAAIE